MSSSLKDKIRIFEDIRENRLIKLKIIMYTILGLAVAISIYYIYRINQETGIDNILGRLYTLDYNYFTILILLIGIIVPVIVGIYIIAFYISQLKRRMARLEKELFFQITEVKKLIMEILTVIEEKDTSEEVVKKEDREMSKEKTMEDETVKEETSDLAVDEDHEEDLDMDRAEDNVELLRELLDGLKEMGRELEKLRRKL